MGAESSTLPHRFSVDHSRVHMPTLAPVVPKSLPPISGSDGISYVCPRSYVHSMEPVPEVSVPRAPPPRGYSGMETSYNAPCDEYIADIEQPKNPVDPITVKPQSWFSVTKQTKKHSTISRCVASSLERSLLFLSSPKQMSQDFCKMGILLFGQPIWERIG